jgi:DNA primase
MDLQHAIEEIKSRIDIVNLISEYVELKKSGQNFKALCPFHSEKTPSFVVSASKQIFHCFGCGTGGDVIAFVMKHDGLSFPEAVRSLAERTGVKIAHSASGHPVLSTKSLRNTLLLIHKEALTFYRNMLLRSRRAKEYLKKRGLTESIVKEFQIGFAPGEKDLLLKLLTDKGYKESEILSSGLCRETERGKRDTFRNRIIFPIINSRGEVIAFGGRTVSEDGYGPKYLNSPETVLFKKSSELFGINLARSAISRKGYVIIMEGYFDVITAHQFGFKNSVAPLGTSLTVDHIKRLKILTKKVLLVFDSDEAGIKASSRALPMLYENGLTAKVMLLPEGDDPHSFLLKKGYKAFEQLFRDVKGIVDFYLGLKGERVDIIRELLFIISKVKSGIIRGELIREVAEKTAISEQFLREELKLLTETKEMFSVNKRTSPTISPEMFLLGLYLNYPAYSSLIKENISPSDLADADVRGIFEKIYTIPDGIDFTSHFSENETSRITEATIQLDIDEEEVEQNVIDCIRHIKTRSYRKKLKDIETEIRIAEKRGETTLVMQLQEKLNTLIREGRDKGVL